MTNSGHNNIIHDASEGEITSGTLPSDRVEWSRSTILEFIEDYRGHRVLWDPNTKGYHIKQIKYEALKKLSRKYSTEVRTIRSKIKSLRSSFHREHGKVISGKRRGINYQPMWFAYEAIRFILDGERDDETSGNTSGSTGASGSGGAVSDGSAAFAPATAAAAAAAACTGANTPSLGIDTNDELMTLGNQNDDLHYTNISAEDVKTEIVEAANCDIADQKTSIQSGIFEQGPKKRSRGLSKEIALHSTQNGLSTQQTRVDSDSDDPQSSQIKRRRQMQATVSDEFGIFGEYVGITIRRLKTSKAQIVIKHLINNLLYDAEMGRYDYGIPTTREPPHLYATSD